MKTIHPGHLEHRFSIFGCQILCITDLAIMPHVSTIGCHGALLPHGAVPGWVYQCRLIALVSSHPRHLRAMVGYRLWAVCATLRIMWLLPRGANWVWQKVGVRGHHLQHQYLLFANFTEQSANFKLSAMASTLKNEKCWTHSSEYMASHIASISNHPPPIDCASHSDFYGDVLGSLEFGTPPPSCTGQCWVWYWAGLSIMGGIQ